MSSFFRKNIAIGCVALFAFAPSAALARLCILPANGTVTVIDSSTNTPIITLDVDYLPERLAISPDGGSRVYVSNACGPGGGAGGTITVINNTTPPSLGSTFSSQGNYPQGLAFTPDGRKLYVANRDSNQIAVFDTDPADVPPNAYLHSITVGMGPQDVFIRGTRLYVTHETDNDVWVIDTLTDMPIPNPPIPVGSGPLGIALTPNWLFGFVANNSSSPPTITKIDTNPFSPGYLSVLGTLSVQAGPEGVAVTPDGSRVYVTNEDGNSVSNIRISDGFTVHVTMGMGVTPEAIAFLPNSKRAYASFEVTNDVRVLDTDPLSGTYNTVLATIPVGSAPEGIAVTPCGDRVYVTNEAGGGY